MTRPILLVLTVLSTIALLAQPVHDATPHDFVHEALAQTGGPSVTGFRGVAPGQSLSGKVVIEALVDGGNITQVVFKLDGPKSVTFTERRVPYYFLGDGGQADPAPKGWRTAEYPDGAYTLAATATDAQGRTGSRSVSFRVANATSDPDPVPTAVPTRTPIPEPSGDMIEGVPVCTDHGRIRWHALVERDGSGRITCTYGHEHHDNPNSINDIFGEPAAWYGGSQEISYPWQTESAAGKENAVKHEGYKVYTKRDIPCRFPDGADACVVAFRVQMHTLGTAADAVVRFHSFALEALVEDPATGARGIARGGGHMDTGFLGLGTDNAEGVSSGMVCPDLPSNPEKFTCKLEGILREASAYNAPPPHHDRWVLHATWYANHKGGLGIKAGLEMFAPIDYEDPSRQLPQKQDNANNSSGRVAGMLVFVRHAFLEPHRDAQGRITYSGWQDRHGAFVSGCASPSADCVPYRLERMPWVRASYAPPVVTLPDHDVKSPVTGKSLIRMPN